MTKSAAERKREQRARLKEKGLVKKEVWIYPEYWEQIKNYIDRVNNKKG